MPRALARTLAELRLAGVVLAVSFAVSGYGCAAVNKVTEEGTARRALIPGVRIAGAPDSHSSALPVRPRRPWARYRDNSLCRY